jgi:hypothetical protein
MKPIEITGYQAVETLRRAELRGPRTIPQELFQKLWRSILSFLGVTK